MVRKGQPGLAGDLMELMAQLPWWAGLVLAGVVYLVLHPLAEREMVINGAKYQSDPGFASSGPRVNRGVGHN